MRFVSLGLLALLGLSVGAVNAAPVAAPVVAEPVAEKDGLKVSIGSIELRSNDPHINVVLQNTSAKPINLFSEGNSGGYNNLTLEITKVDGKVLDKPLIVARDYVPWRANMLSYQVIDPGEAIVREVRLQVPKQVLDPSAPATDSERTLRRDFYGNFPAPTQGSQRQITMRSVFANDDSNNYEGKKHWTGRIASPLKDYTVFWRAN